MSGKRANEDDLGQSRGTAWVSAQGASAAEDEVDDDFPRLEMRQIYVTASVVLSAWLAIALFFADLPPTLRDYAVHFAAHLDGVL